MKKDSTKKVTLVLSKEQTISLSIRNKTAQLIKDYFSENGETIEPTLNPLYAVSILYLKKDPFCFKLESWFRYIKDSRIDGWWYGCYFTYFLYFREENKEFELVDCRTTKIYEKLEHFTHTSISAKIFAWLFDDIKGKITLWTTF